MEEALRALLLASSGVASLAPSARINWGAHPQGADLPSLVLNTISGSEGLTMSGPDGIETSRVQIDAYAHTYAGAKILSRAVIAALHAYRSGAFRLVVHEGTRDSREGGSNEAERPFRCSMDFTVNWRAN